MTRWCCRHSRKCGRASGRVRRAFAVHKIPMPSLPSRWQSRMEPGLHCTESRLPSFHSRRWMMSMRFHTCAPITQAMKKRRRCAGAWRNQIQSDETAAALILQFLRADDVPRGTRCADKKPRIHSGGSAADGSEKEFKGYIHDVGGPTADFRGPACKKQLTKGA